MAFVWQRLATMARLAPLHMSPAFLRVTALGALGAQHGDGCTPRLLSGKTIWPLTCIDLRDVPRARS